MLNDKQLEKAQMFRNQAMVEELFGKGTYYHETPYEGIFVRIDVSANCNTIYGDYVKILEDGIDVPMGVELFAKSENVEEHSIYHTNSGNMSKKDARLYGQLFMDASYFDLKKYFDKARK